MIHILTRVLWFQVVYMEQIMDIIIIQHLLKDCQMI